MSALPGDSRENPAEISVILVSMYALAAPTAGAIRQIAGRLVKLAGGLARTKGDRPPSAHAVCRPKTGGPTGRRLCCRKRRQKGGPGRAPDQIWPISGHRDPERRAAA